MKSTIVHEMYSNLPTKLVKDLNLISSFNFSFTRQFAFQLLFWTFRFSFSTLSSFNFLSINGQLFAKIKTYTNSIFSIVLQFFLSDLTYRYKRVDFLSVTYLMGINTERWKNRTIGPSMKITKNTIFGGLINRQQMQLQSRRVQGQETCYTFKIKV